MVSKKNLVITHQNEYLDKFTQQTSELHLLAAADGVEVMKQRIDAGVMFRITPASKSHTVEFFYILEGELEGSEDDSDESKKLKTGDSFTAQNLDRDYIFKTITDCYLLYVSSDPIFYRIGENMREMHRLNAELEAKDEYTKGHSDRVHNYSLAIAQEYGLDRDRAFMMAMAALFHDIGKIEIPAEILLKPGKLTDEEFELIKSHPTISAKIVKEKHYRDVSDIVIQHHERINGTGYPAGLTEDEICIEAKIIAVADTFDAMTSDRPYREGLDRKLAIEEINSLSGSWFDPDVVEAFNRFVKKLK